MTICTHARTFVTVNSQGEFYPACGLCDATQLFGKTFITMTDVNATPPVNKPDEQSQITEQALKSGFKADAGKARLDLVPADTLRFMVARLISDRGYDSPMDTALRQTLDGLCNFWAGENEANALRSAILSAQDVIALDLEIPTPDTVLLLGELYALGAKKYADRNWEQGMDWGRCYAAAMRHFVKFLKGERNDEVDGQHHFTSVMWCAVALLHFYENPEKYRQFDSRAKIEVAAANGQQ